MKKTESLIDFYSKHAARLSQQYEQLSAQEIHKDWRRFIPDSPSFILDAGAGSGRDAAWLAEMGHKVIAAEPAKGFRDEAQQRHGSSSIQWINDCLPYLNKTRCLNIKFDLILLSAVWMHIPPEDRLPALKTLNELIKHTGHIIITLRHGPPSQERIMYPVSREELEILAEDLRLDTVFHTQNKDLFNRAEVSWSLLVLRKEI